MADIHGNYVKQLAKIDKVTVNWLPTEANVADIFTKPLERNLQRRFTRKFMKI